MNLFYLVSISIVVMIFSTCKKDSGGSSPIVPVVNTPLQVKATVSRSKDYDGSVSTEYFVEVFYQGLAVNTATVNVNGTNVPLELPNPCGFYDLTGYNSTVPGYIPGQNYTVTVVYNGKTYTQTETAPGGFFANTDYTTLTWLINGMKSMVEVDHLYGACTYTTGTTSPATITVNSPQNIPAAKAYPTSGSYTVFATVDNYADKFFGVLTGDSCSMDVSDYKQWRVVK